MAKLFGCPINVEADEEVDDGISIAGEVSRSGNQPNGEATSFPAGFPPFNQREETNPYIRFLESNSDSGSVSMESESDLHLCFIDFFDRESYISSNQRLSTSYDFNIWGAQDMEEEIELGLRIGSGSGSDDSAALGLQVTRSMEIDTRRVEIDSGRVEIGDDLFVDHVESENAITWVVSEPVEANLLSQEEVEGISLFQEPIDYNQEDQEWHDDLFDVLFEDSLDVALGTDIFDSPLGVFLPIIDEYAENHGDYEDVLARTFDESGINGSPPASKRVVDELPDVQITSEELSIGCAVCKDEIVVEEKVKRLPCKHYYHKECIVPWLGIRNTCPVCRYELPTDDLEYERNRRSGYLGSLIF